MPFTIAFTGDVSYADTYYAGKEKSSSYGVYNRAMHRGRTLEELIDESMLSKMRAADLLVVNCESSVSDRGTALGLKGKEYSFRTSTKIAPIFSYIGADLIGLANNHVYDFGRDAFLDTLDVFRDLGIPTFGAGRNAAEAYEPYYFTAGGTTVALIAASAAESNYFTLVAEENSPGICGCYDVGPVCAKIREAKTKADFVIVYPHCGKEGSYDVITEKQRAISESFIDAGADMVIGGHAHRIQGIESYHGKLIFWNMGNFLFGNSTLPTMLLTLHFDAPGHCVPQIAPGTQTDGTVIDDTGSARGEETLSLLRSLSYGIAIDRDGYVYDCSF